MKRKLLTMVLSVIMLIAAIGQPILANNDVISVYLNGKQLQFDVPPQIINERTMVPLRAIFEALGASVNWDGATKTVTSSKDDISISLTVDSTIMFVNGNAVTLDSPACIVDGRTLVPVRAISEAYNAEVNWDGSKQVISIIFDSKAPSPNDNISKSKVPQNFTDGYEPAVFSKFNSYASENGLRDTKIYMNGLIKKIEVLQTDAELGNVIVAVFDDNNNNEWLILMNFTGVVRGDDFDSIIGKPIVLCGAYDGYSDKYNMPSVWLVELCVVDSGETKSGFGKMSQILKSDTNSNTDTTEKIDMDNTSVQKVSLRNSKDVEEYLEGKYGGFSFTTSKTDGFDTVTETEKIKIEHALVYWDSPNKIKITLCCDSYLRYRLSPYPLYPEKTAPCYNAAKKYMKTIAEDLMEKLPDVEISDVHFWYSWYKYPNLKIELNSVSYCRWRAINGSFEWWPTSDDWDVQDRI